MLRCKFGHLGAQVGRSELLETETGANLRGLSRGSRLRVGNFLQKWREAVRIGMKKDKKYTQDKKWSRVDEGENSYNGEL